MENRYIGSSNELRGPAAWFKHKDGGAPPPGLDEDAVEINPHIGIYESDTIWYIEIPQHCRHPLWRYTGVGKTNSWGLATAIWENKSEYFPLKIKKNGKADEEDLKIIEAWDSNRIAGSRPRKMGTWRDLEDFLEGYVGRATWNLIEAFKIANELVRRKIRPEPSTFDIGELIPGARHLNSRNARFETDPSKISEASGGGYYRAWAPLDNLNPAEGPLPLETYALEQIPESASLQDTQSTYSSQGDHPPQALANHPGQQGSNANAQQVEQLAQQVDPSGQIQNVSAMAASTNIQQAGRGGNASRGGNPTRGGNVSRGGNSTRGGSASRGGNPARGGNPSQGSNPARGGILKRGRSF